MNPETVFFTADQHFNHNKIIAYANRPFGSVEEMNELMIERHNKIVPKKADVFCLGDFTFGDPAPFANRLNGRKHLIVGNHDPSKSINWTGWSSVNQYLELKVARQKYILFHYPIKRWNASFHGRKHFYGHVHGSEPANAMSCDVGVDCWDYAPVSLARLLEFMSTLPDPRDLTKKNVESDDFDDEAYTPS